MNELQELLIITMEECGELIQACSKIYRHGHNEKDMRSLAEEIADVETMILLLKKTGIVDEEIVSAKKEEKVKYEKYHGKFK